MWGLLYDVHGNLPALEAVLADAGRRGRRPLAARRRLRAVRRLAGGDGRAARDAAGDVDPRQQRALAGERRRGARRRDGRAVRSPAAPALLGAERVARLGRAARERRAARRHAAPGTPRRSPTCARSCPIPRADDAELLAGADASRGSSSATRICRSRASTRRPASRSSTPAASACRSTATRARPGRFSHDDGTIEHRRTRYDHASAARRIREVAHGEPWGEVVAKRIERAQFVVR